jgi:hypothetical protein
MENEKLINCTEFETHLTDYLDKTLDSSTNKAVAAHALKCPLCHSLLNDVKIALEVCHEIAVPKPALTKLEARILSATMPDFAMSCEEFETHLTDYLDGFLPASVFHRWERHACLCSNCEDLPGEVVRSIATVISYKSDELPLPEGLHAKILQSTIGTENAKAMKASKFSQFGEWLRSWEFPISIPQLAPVAMMLLLAFMIVTQTVSADGSISGAYQKSFELAEQTYKESSGIVFGDKTIEQKSNQEPNQEPIQGTFVNEGNRK